MFTTGPAACTGSAAGPTSIFHRTKKLGQFLEIISLYLRAKKEATAYILHIKHVYYRACCMHRKCSWTYNPPDICSIAATHYNTTKLAIWEQFFLLPFSAIISPGSMCKQLEFLFTDFWKRNSNCLQRDPNDIFPLKDKEKIALKIGRLGFSHFLLLFAFSLKTCLRWQKLAWKPY